MKKYYFLSLVIIFFSSNFIFCQSTRWRLLINKPTYEIYANPLNLNTMFAGGEGRLVYRTYDRGRTWDTLIVNYKGGAAILNNVFIPETDTNSVIVGGLLFGDVRRSTDQGQTWDIVIEAKLHPIALNGKALEQKPDDPNVLYIGDFQSGTIFRSTDAGAHWDSISTVLKPTTYTDSSGIVHDTLEPVLIASISIRHDSTSIIFANSTSGEVYISTDGGYNWQFVQRLVDPKIDDWDSEITRMVFSNRDPRTGYAVITYLFYSNNPNGGLYKTTDGGWSWSQIAFADTSMWAVACRGYGDNDEVFIGGYTEHFWTYDETKVPGVGIVRRSLDGGNTWFSYDNHIDWYYPFPRQEADLLSLFCPTDSTAIAVGKMGTIMYTPNRGRRWSYQTNNSWENLHSVFFPSAKTGFTCGNNGTILKTYDAGNNWMQLVTNTNKNLRSIYFLDTLQGIAVGENGIIIKTTNGGNNWIEMNSGTSKSLFSVSLKNTGVGVAVGEDGTVIETNDFGENWFKKETGYFDTIYAVSFVDNSTLFLSGEKGSILKSTDGGESWQLQQNIPTAENLRGLHFRNSNLGFAVGDKGTFLRTETGGNSWISYNIYSTRQINTVYYFNDTMGLIAGRRNLIFKTTDGGAEWESINYGYGTRANVWSQRYFGDVPGEEKLYMATEAGLYVLDYPSPVIELASIEKRSNLNVFTDYQKNLSINYYPIKINSNQNFTFRVVNLLGNIIIQETITRQNESVIIKNYDISSLTKGFYLCQMFEGNNVSNRIIIIE